MQTLKMALIGEHISRSRLSRAMAILCACQNVELEFKPIDTALIDPFDFDEQISELREAGFTGTTVTHPFKTHADTHASRRIGYPQTMGASNLLKFDGEEILAFNTDFTGFKEAWQARFGDDRPGAVAMAGAGGVARAIAAALIDLGASKIYVWDQAPDAARALADQLDPDKRTIEPIEEQDAPKHIAHADGLVNATPMGMAEYPGMAIDPELIELQKWAFDAVYTPLNTRFLTVADKANIATLSGFDLFKNMALGTFTAYTNIDLTPQDTDLLTPLSENL